MPCMWNSVFHPEDTHLHAELDLMHWSEPTVFGRTPRTPAALTPAPEAEAPSTPMSVLDEPVEAVSDADPSELPFSARIPPGDSETAMPAKTNTEFDEIFLQANADRRNYRRMYQSSGSNTLFEYACDENSAVGEVCDEIGVDGIRLYIP